MPHQNRSIREFSSSTTTARFHEGAVAMRSSLDRDTVLRYTAAEWEAFVLGARDGEFDLDRHRP